MKWTHSVAPLRERNFRWFFALAFGPLAAVFGFEEVLVVSGVAYFVICGLTLLSRSVRDLPRRPEQTRAGVEPSGQPAA